MSRVAGATGFDLDARPPFVGHRHFVFSSVGILALAGGAVAQTVVMSGLDNARGLAFSPNGALYVAEAGRGGPGPCAVNAVTGETRCFGNSGAITRLWMGQQSRVALGLESHALPDGSSANGSVETVAVFPPLPNPTPVGPPMVEAVPTAVARGNDGDLYVGQLTGFPLAPAVKNIYRVAPGQDPVVHCGGFKALMDLAFGPDGNLYVVENAIGGVPPFGLFFLPNTGRLSRVAPDCTVTPVLVGLNRPTAVAVGADGAVYVTNNGVTAGAGQVLMITP